MGIQICITYKEYLYNFFLNLTMAEAEPFKGTKEEYFMERLAYSFQFRNKANWPKFKAALDQEDNKYFECLHI